MPPWPTGDALEIVCYALMGVIVSGSKRICQEIADFAAIRGEDGLREKLRTDESCRRLPSGLAPFAISYAAIECFVGGAVQPADRNVEPRAPS
jgi:hypothetical protein